MRVVRLQAKVDGLAPRVFIDVDDQVSLLKEPVCDLCASAPATGIVNWNPCKHKTHPADIPEAAFHHSRPPTDAAEKTFHLGDAGNGMQAVFTWDGQANQ